MKPINIDKMLNRMKPHRHRRMELLLQSGFLSSHPTVAYYRQKKALELAQMKFEQSQLMELEK